MQYVKDFSTSPHLSESDRVVSNLLNGACGDIATIYDLQENNQYFGANLYPHDATKEEIEESAKENPLILSEYTLVTRDTKGKLVTIPYHEQFKPPSNFSKIYSNILMEIYSRRLQGDRPH